MADHAGFAAVLAIEQHVLVDVVRAAYGNGVFSRSLVEPLLPEREIDFGLTLFVDAPQVRLGDDGSVEIGVRSWGRLDKGRFGVITNSWKVLIETSSTAAMTCRRASAGEPLRLGLEGASTRTGSLTVLSGPALPDDDRTRVSLAIGMSGGRLDAALAKVDLSGLIDHPLLARIRATRSATATIRTHGSRLFIGFDVTGAETIGTTPTITTVGDPAALSPFTNDDIALSINPIALPLAFGVAAERVKIDLAAQDISLDQLDVASNNGFFAVSGRIHLTGATGSFSLRATPRLSPTALEFEISEQTSEAHATGWRRVLQILSQIVPGAIFVAAFFQLAGQDGEPQFSLGLGQKRDARFLVPNTHSPWFRARLERFDVSAEQLLTSLSVRATFDSGGIIGPDGISAEEVRLDRAFVEVTLPFGIGTDDETVELRWTVWTDDDANPVLVQTIDAPLALALWLPAHQKLLDARRVRIAVRVYRRLGERVEELLQARHIMQINDIDRSHPYIRVTHNVRVPSVHIEADGHRTLQGYPLRRRTSAIHRTDLPGRCRMVVKLARDKDRFGPEIPLGFVEALDELPFGREHLLEHRDEVCDYCFFGGPTGNVPLIP